MIGERLDALETAYRLRISTDTLYKLCSRGEIPHAREGRRYVFDALAVNLYHRQRAKVRVPRHTAFTSSDYTQAQIDLLPYTGSVYFIQAVSGGPIKIGKADDPQRRLYDLQAMNPTKLQILATVDGGQRREYELHVRFKGSRLHGEWFEPTPELLSLISDLKAGHRGTQ